MTSADRADYAVCPECGTQHHPDDEAACEAALAMQEPDFRSVPFDDDEYAEAEA